MMKKAIATISVDPIIKEQCEIIQGEKTKIDQEFEFLRNRANKSVERMNEKCRAHWDAIEARLKELNILPANFDGKDGSLCFDSDGNVIYMEDGQVGPFDTMQFKNI